MARGPLFSRNRICRTCGIRWSHEHGMCRRCQRAIEPTSIECEQAQVEAVERREAEILQALLPPRVPVPPARTIVVDGSCYVVSWDGAVRPLEIVH